MGIWKKRAVYLLVFAIVLTGILGGGTVQASDAGFSENHFLFHNVENEGE